MPKVEKNQTIQFANDNPLGIKIKETTKPEEIRITDDKPKPFKPTKSTTTPTSTTTTTTASTTTTTITESNKDSSTTELTSTTVLNNDAVTESAKKISIEDLNVNTQENVDYLMDDGTRSDDNVSSDTFAPSTKATTVSGEVEPEIFLVNADTNSLNDESSNKSVRQALDNATANYSEQSSESTSEISLSSTTENEIESSSTEISLTSTSSNDEKIDLSMSSTPKNVVIVRQDGKTESFQVFGTDGLQRVEELEIVSSTTENSIEENSDSSSELSTLGSVTVANAENSQEKSLEDQTSHEKTENFDKDTPNVPTNKKNLDSTLESSSENSPVENVTPSDLTTENTSDNSFVSEQVFETFFYTEDNSKEKTTASPLNSEPFETKFYEASSDDGFSVSSTTTFDADSFSSSSDIPVSTTPSIQVTSEAVPVFRSTSTGPCVETSSRTFEDEESTLVENPEFPYIPDDLTIHCKEAEEDEKRRIPSKVVVEDVSSTTIGILEHISVANKENAKLINGGSTTVGPPTEETKQSQETDSGKALMAPGEPFLVPGNFVFLIF